MASGAQPHLEGLGVLSVGGKRPRGPSDTNTRAALCGMAETAYLACLTLPSVAGLDACLLACAGCEVLLASGRKISGAVPDYLRAACMLLIFRPRYTHTRTRAHAHPSASWHEDRRRRPHSSQTPAVNNFALAEAIRCTPLALSTKASTADSQRDAPMRTPCDPRPRNAACEAMPASQSTRRKHGDV